jgi:FkbM family methyltransferase
MRTKKKIINLFNYHFFRIYIYHPSLLIVNFLRYPSQVIKLFRISLTTNLFNVYGFKIYSPKKIDKYFFANLNTKFNSLVKENYETSERELILKHLKNDDKVLELGGCIGVISNVINKKINNKDKHVVLEIDKLKYEYLNKNKRVNNANFHLINGALSNKQNLYYEGSGNFWSGRLVNYKTLAPISTISLADLQEKFNIKFNTLVMDIEGGEFDVFSEIDFKYLKKVIFENHFSLSSNKYIIMEEILNNNNFKKKEINGKVEFWCKK